MVTGLKKNKFTQKLATGAAAFGVLAGIGLVTARSVSAASVSIFDAATDETIQLFHSGWNVANPSVVPEGPGILGEANFTGQYLTTDPTWVPGSLVSKSYNIFGGDDMGIISDTLTFTSSYIDPITSGGSNLGFTLAYLSGSSDGQALPPPLEGGTTIDESLGFQLVPTGVSDLQVGFQSDTGITTPEPSSVLGLLAVGGLGLGMLRKKQG